MDRPTLITALDSTLRSHSDGGTKAETVRHTSDKADEFEKTVTTSWDTETVKVILEKLISTNMNDTDVGELEKIDPLLYLLARLNLHNRNTVTNSGTPETPFNSLKIMTMSGRTRKIPLNDFHQCQSSDGEPLIVLHMGKERAVNVIPKKLNLAMLDVFDVQLGNFAILTVLPKTRSGMFISLPREQSLGDDPMDLHIIVSPHYLTVGKEAETTDKNCDDNMLAKSGGEPMPDNGLLLPCDGEPKQACEGKDEENTPGNEGPTLTHNDSDGGGEVNTTGIDGLKNLNSGKEGSTTCADGLRVPGGRDEVNTTGDEGYLKDPDGDEEVNTTVDDRLKDLDGGDEVNTMGVDGLKNLDSGKEGSATCADELRAPGDRDDGNATGDGLPHSGNEGEGIPTSGTRLNNSNSVEERETKGDERLKNPDGRAQESKTGPEGLTVPSNENKGKNTAHLLEFVQPDSAGADAEGQPACAEKITPRKVDFSGTKSQPPNQSTKPSATDKHLFMSVENSVLIVNGTKTKPINNWLKILKIKGNKDVFSDRKLLLQYVEDILERKVTPPVKFVKSFVEKLVDHAVDKELNYQSILVSKKLSMAQKKKLIRDKILATHYPNLVFNSSINAEICLSLTKKGPVTGACKTKSEENTKHPPMLMSTSESPSPSCESECDERPKKAGRNQETRDTVQNKKKKKKKKRKSGEPGQPNNHSNEPASISKDAKTPSLKRTMRGKRKPAGIPGVVLMIVVVMLT